MRRFLSQRLLTDQGGAAVLALAVAACFFGLALSVGLLLKADTALRGASRLLRLGEFYARDAGIEHAFARLAYETGFARSLPANTPISYNLTINNVPTTVTLTRVSSGGATSKYAAFKSVNPTWGIVDQANTFQYTISIRNASNSPARVEFIEDRLPNEFSYILGSSSGLTTADPAIGSNNFLRWDFNPPLTIPQNTTATQTFQAFAPAKTKAGTYQNRVIAKVQGTRLDTHFVAPVRIAKNKDLDLTLSVAPSLAMANQPTSFLYTIEVNNTTTHNPNLNEIKFWIDAPFSYESGSTGQDCSGATTRDPDITSPPQDPLPFRYTWTLSSGRTVGPVIPAGSKVVHCFRASAALDIFNYHHQAEINASGDGLKGTTLNTSLTAPISVAFVVDVKAQAAGETSHAAVTILPDEALISDWVVR